MKEMGVGLAVAVLIDATIVRAILLPAAMKLLGDRNWYLPSALGWLPRVDARRAGGRAGARVAARSGGGRAAAPRNAVGRASRPEGRGARLLSARRGAQAAAGCRSAQAAISFEPPIHSPSSVSSAGTQYSAGALLTFLRVGVCRAPGSAPTTVRDTSGSCPASRSAS